jgi:choice-of-anchor A domain-containing protein
LGGPVVDWTKYNVISFDNFNGDSGAVGGRLAVKNSMTLGTGYSVGYDIDDPNRAQIQIQTYSLIVGHTASWGSGELYPASASKEEYAFVGDSFTGPQAIADRVLGNAGTLGRSTDSDFAAAQAYYVSLSQNFALEADNAVTSVQWSGLFFTCNSAADTRHIATVDGSVFATVSWFAFEGCNSQATWVINIDGTGDVSFAGGNLPGIGERVLYNVIGSGRTVTISTGVNGNILAPQCTVTQPGGVTLGLVIAGNIPAMFSTVNPNCADFEPFTVSSRLSGAASAGDDSVSLVTFSALLAGDVITFDQGESNEESVAIAERQQVDGDLVAVLTSPLQYAHDDMSYVITFVQNPSNATRNTDEITVINSTSSGSEALVASFVAAVTAFIFA